MGYRMGTQCSISAGSMKLDPERWVILRWIRRSALRSSAIPTRPVCLAGSEDLNQWIEWREPAPLLTDALLMVLLAWTRQRKCYAHMGRVSGTRILGGAESKFAERGGFQWRPRVRDNRAAH